MPVGTPGEEMPVGTPGEEMPVGFPGKEMPVGTPGQSFPLDPAKTSSDLNADVINSNINKINKINRNIDDIRNDIDSLEESSYKGIAVAIAMASAPQAIDAHSSSFSLGAGSYKSQTGMALGFSHRFERTTINLNVGSAGSDSTAVGAGIGYSF